MTINSWAEVIQEIISKLPPVYAEIQSMESGNIALGPEDLYNLYNTKEKPKMKDKNFYKYQLHTGMKVILRNGVEYTVLRNTDTEYDDCRSEDLVFVNNKKDSHDWNKGDYLSDNLSHTDGWKLGDVVEVLIPEHPYDIFYNYSGYKSIWKREEEQSVEEKQLNEIMTKISELQEQADILKEMLGK